MTDRHNIRPEPTPLERPENGSTVMGLIRQLSHEVQQLFTKELALAKAEMQESLRSTKAGIAGVAGGVVVLLGGFIMLLLSAVYGLSLVVAPWLAALIVGGVVTLAGFIMVQAGKKQFEPSHLTPDRTVSSLQKDKDAVMRRMT